MAKAAQVKEQDQIEPPAEAEKPEAELQPEGEVEVKIEPETEEVEVEDPSIALQKQVEALRKSEEIHKKRAEASNREAEAARAVAHEREVEVGKSRKEILQSQFDAVSTALAASQSEAESAKISLRAAKANQDVEAEIEASERLFRAQANIVNLENGKGELESRLKAPEPQPDPRKLRPDRVDRWIKGHQEWMEDTDKNADLQYYHRKVIKRGIPFDSEEYIVAMEVEMGLREAEQEEEAVAPKPKVATQPKTPQVSAPVSREAPSTPDGDRGGVVRLSPAEREAAKIAGVTEKVYAENLVKIRKMKANGSYGGQT